MKIVGLTGGIGSGKTTVAKMFAEKGVPVYIADDEAKKIADFDQKVKQDLIEILGKEAYNKNGMNRPFVANLVFNDKELLRKVNAIIHPKVGEHFRQWLLGQDGTYCIKEAAILFENGGYKNCDLTILVTAPKKIRVQRILNRDNTTVASIKQRMENQWSDAEKKKLADIVITNVDLEETKKEVAKIHKKLSKPQ